MKAVAMFVILAGYTLVAYGVNHLTSGCVSFRDVIWPSTSTITDPCANAVKTQTAAAKSTAATAKGGPTPGQTLTIPGQGTTKIKLL